MSNTFGLFSPEEWPKKVVLFVVESDPLRVLICIWLLFVPKMIVLHRCLSLPRFLSFSAIGGSNRMKNRLVIAIGRQKFYNAQLSQGIAKLALVYVAIDVWSGLGRVLERRTSG